MDAPTPLFRLIYKSRMQPPVALEALAAQARRNNPVLGITGGLAVLDGTFLQYLEGTEAAVRSLFDRMVRDPRHRDIQVLEERGIPRRMFADWTMARLEWNGRTEAIFRSFSPESGLDLYQTDASTAAPLFRAWAATADWVRL